MCNGLRVETIIITVAKIYTEMTRGPLGGLYASSGPDIIYGYMRRVYYLYIIICSDATISRDF